MKSGEKLVLMNSRRIERSLTRIAHQIREQNRDDKPVLIYGIDERGYVVAEKLAEVLKPLTDKAVYTRQIFIKMESENSDLGQAPAGSAFTLVVDDVIFTGKTMFRALKLLSDHTSLPEIHTAVLIDRGHRKWPVMAELRGMELPTKLNEHVTVDNKLQHVELHNIS